MNGPGLRWAQGQFSSRLGLDDEETAAPPAAAPRPLVGDPEGPSGIPANPIPPLFVEPSAMTKAGPKTAAAAMAAPVNLPSLGPAELPAPGRPEPPTASRDGERPAPKGALAGAAAAFASLAGKAKEREADLEKGTAAPEPGDWQAVRRSLRDLGASRYGVEGPPEGRVRFYCVIPVAGRRAVSQYFEAEGDDEFQAARAAIRRVALWRATEGEAPPPEAESVTGR